MAEATQPKKTREITATLCLRKHANSAPYEFVLKGGCCQPQHVPASKLIRIVADALADSLKLEIGEPS